MEGKRGVASPAFVRLGPSSAELSRQLDEAAGGPHKSDVELTCAQVPNQFGPGSPIWLWLGSDNNKGAATDWAQGIRALGRCKSNDRIEGSKEYRVVLRDLYLLPRSISKLELLEASPETYARELANAAIIGLNNYSSQVVQILTDDEFATIGAMIADLIPEVQENLFKRLPGASGIKLIPRPEEDATATASATSSGEEEPELPPYTTELGDEDEVLQEVRHLIEDDNWGGVLLQGAPGTGKSWYARQIAIKLTGGERRRIREVQFHPSYQSEDFVEGYVPKGSAGFVLRDKHLLEMIEVAKNNEGPVVLVIDEFSRTDPARVLGEAMTYMEGSLREVDFSLPSGRKVSIPKNLVFLATMNPDDRSVDEIDAAMDRRWAKIHLKPDVDRLRDFLTANHVEGALFGAIVEFFVALQEHIEIGHAFFRTVRDLASLERLWERQLQYVVKKRFRFDPEAQASIGNLWTACLVAGEAPSAAPEAPAAEPVPAEAT
jgi:5-methylcytosine-specific restriction protein B